MGGTNFATASTIGDETTWNDGGSGFSNEFGRPSFQDDEVTNYLSSASDLPKASMYNASGRAYPDLAALAGLTNAYLVALGGGSNFAAVGGTSAASPTVAAMIAQINDLRLAADGSSLGWLNPALYTCGQSCFNDVTTRAKIKDGSRRRRAYDPRPGGRSASQRTIHVVAGRGINAIFCPPR